MQCERKEACYNAASDFERTARPHTQERLVVLEAVSRSLGEELEAATVAARDERVATAERLFGVLRANRDPGGATRAD